MPRLIHLNGAPGSGKSTVAARWASDHPGALVVEIDQLRVQLDGWQTDESSKLLARELAIGLIGAHLASGEDVIVPQYLGRLAFIERLEQAAASHDAVFVEILLTTDVSTNVDRFTARNLDREEEHAGHAAHPAMNVEMRDAPALISDAIGRLETVVASRPEVVPIDGAQDVDDVVAALFDALGDAR